ncbi:MAG: hypothetical protein IJ639_10160, partial [Ruminococcus sp.]|nr:hypothetical protein [Ruminococcus sp.]
AADRLLRKEAEEAAQREAQKDAYLEEKGLTRAWVEEKIATRTEAKAAKDWAAADAIRDELKEKGIVIKDSKSGATWEIE